jgi:hypothetical protein
MNDVGEFPVDVYFTNLIGGNVVNFEAVDLILDNMAEQCRGRTEKIEVDLTKKRPILVSNFARVLDITFVDQFSAMFDKIVAILKSLDEKSIISVDTFADQIDPSSHLTPFMELCRKYSLQKKVKRSILNNHRKETHFLFEQVNKHNKAKKCGFSSSLNSIIARCFVLVTVNVSRNNKYHKYSSKIYLMTKFQLNKISK